MVESLRCHHRTLQSVGLKRRFDPIDDSFLALGKQIFGGDHVSIVSAPIANPNLGIMLDHFFKCDRLARSSMKQGVPFIGSSPLWSGDEEFPARLGRVRATACSHQALDQRLLLIGRNRVHVDLAFSALMISCPVSGARKRLWTRAW